MKGALALLILAAGPCAAEQAQLVGVNVEKAKVTVYLSVPSAYDVVAQTAPPRLAFIFPGVLHAGKDKFVDGEGTSIKDVKTAALGADSEVVVDLAAPAMFEAAWKGKGLVVDIKDKLSPPPPECPAPAAAKGGYFIQLGAFAAERRALALKASIPGSQVTALGQLFAVRLGPYPDKAAAIEASKPFRARGERPLIRWSALSP